MKIIHLANWNSTNIGNGALIYGTQRLIEEDFKDKVYFIEEAWDDYTFGLKKFDEEFVELVNNTSDALLINGAVTMNAFRKFNKNTGMRFDLPLGLWSKIKKPIIFYGISYRSWPFQEYPNKEALIKTINYILTNKKIFFGVRNDGTKEWIEKVLGIKSSKIYEVPDPGLFVPVLDTTYPELDSNKKNIIIAFNGEDPIYRFATPKYKFLWNILRKTFNTDITESIFNKIKLYKIERSRIVKEIAIVVENLANKYNTQFILVPHYLDDYGMIDEFINIVNERVAHQLTVSTGLLKVKDTKLFYGRYKKADLAISMRVHSMSPSIGLGIPVIPITSQGRMRNFLKKIQLPDIGVEASENNFSSHIINKADILLNRPEKFREGSIKVYKKLRDDVKNINKLIFDLINFR
jgi:polysaccharide pyruvyl transferase WcaK-like protein